MEFTLPAAVRLAGRVTDASTNKPIANVIIRYLPSRQNDPAWRPDMFSCVECPVCTDAEGRFSLAVSRAGGHLLLQAQEDDYRVAAADVGILLDGVKWDKTRHAHAIVPIDSVVGAGPHPDMRKIELHRGISIKGTVVKPDGQPLSGGYLICRRRVWVPWLDREKMRPVVLTCLKDRSLSTVVEPGQVEKVLIVDSTGHWGAVADLVPPASSTETVIIRAEPCGQATVTFVNANGDPMPGVEIKLTLGMPECNAVFSKPAAADRLDAHRSMVFDPNCRSWSRIYRAKCVCLSWYPVPPTNS